LQMNHDLHFSASVYGFGAGLFFIGYALCEVPSNLLLLRFGAKRWLARIMFTWGLLAAATMFVRTPWQFNAIRLLLGAAEAGFFPGVIYYLTLWFPARMRARAVSRFYIALPLSSVVMGSLAGWLLGLGGKLGLAGWQWLFLIEGLPAVLFSFVILKLLPDNPARAAWLTPEEKAWLQSQLKTDSQQAHLGHEAGVMQALLSPKVWLIGAYFFCALTTNYAYGFSAPAILQGATGWSVTNVGFIVACFGLAGAVHCPLPGNGCCLCRCELCADTLDGRVVSRGELRFLPVDAGAGSLRPHAVSGWASRGGWNCGHEYHHHVQRLCRTLLDGRHEGCHRELPGRA